MIYAQATKKCIMIAPQSLGTTAVTGTVDTAGYDHAEIEFIMAAAATTVTMTTAVLNEADSGTSYTAISTSTFSHSTLAAGGTSVTGDVAIFDVDLRGRKKVLQVSLANSAARICTVVATLSRAQEAPTTAATRGLTGWDIG